MTITCRMQKVKPKLLSTLFFVWWGIAEVLLPFVTFWSRVSIIYVCKEPYRTLHTYFKAMLFKVRLGLRATWFNTISILFKFSRLQCQGPRQSWWYSSVPNGFNWPWRSRNDEVFDDQVALVRRWYLEDTLHPRASQMRAAVWGLAGQDMHCCLNQLVFAYCELLHVQPLKKRKKMLPGWAFPSLSLSQRKGNHASDESMPGHSSFLSTFTISEYFLQCRLY